MLLCKALTRFLAYRMSMARELACWLNLYLFYCKQARNNPDLKDIFFVDYHPECFIQTIPKY